MKYTPLIRVVILALCSTLIARPDEPVKTGQLNVLTMREIPAGAYAVQLQHEGKDATVKLTIEDNRAEFIESTSSKLDGLAGTFEPIGNGVFLARLSCRNGGATQFWIFKPDGSASIKEIPDRGEKQIAKRIPKD